MRPWRRRLAFPDEYGWFVNAAGRAARALTPGFQPRVVVATAPPFSGHLTAARIAREAGVPLVLDYRDLWSGNPFVTTSAARARRMAAAEDETLARAAGVVVVTAGMAAALRGRPAACADVRVIPNGYDEADFAGDVVGNPGGPFTVTYAGQLYKGRMPWAFLEGAAAFCRARRFGPDDFLVRFIGPVGPSVTERVKGYGVPFLADGFIGHADAVRAIREADVNLVVIGGDAGAEATLTGKVFEYLRAGRPILAVAPPAGEAAALVRRFDAGFVAPPDEPAAVTRVLGDLYDKRRSAPAGPPAGLEEFERRNLTGRLAAFLDDVTP